MEGVDIYDLKKIHLDKDPRPVQTELLDFTINSIKSNKKYIVLDAPTGTGKSYFTCMFMDWFKKKFDISAQFDILTNSKILQEQYTRDFDFMNSLWGRASYQCEKYQCDCGVGSEWARLQNTKCDNCPYTVAKYKFENGDVALTNFHLFLTYMIYMPGAWKRSSRVLIIDEGHEFDNVFCDFITTKLSKPLLKRNGFNDYDVEKVFNELPLYPEEMLIDQFVDFINSKVIPVAKSVQARLLSEADEGNIKSLEYAQSLTNNIQKWDILSTEYGEDPDNWILEVEKITKKDKKNAVIEEYYEMTAQPVWAHKYLAENIWNNYDYIIFMSGTILDKNLFCKMNGLDADYASYLSVDSPFPAENRPIYFFRNIGKQTFKTKDIVWPKQKEVLKKILKRHKNEKGIIHTANYELQGWVRDQINDKRFLAHKSDNRSETLQEHYNSDEPTVLISPSMMVGVDLKDELSRHQTILKIPYPNLKSKKIKKRMDTMKEWYGLKTVQDLIQAYGRSVRSADDEAATYVLDGCFADLLKWNNHLFPHWIKEAIHYID